MLKIRLQKTGRKGESSFRLVLTDSQNGPKSGRFKEILGSYNPQFNEKNLKADRITYWIGNGAQVSDTVHNILVGEGVIKGKKLNVLPQKSPVVDEEALKAEAEAKAAAEAEAKAAEEAEAAPAEESTDASSEEAPAETPAQEAAPEAPAEEEKATESEDTAPAEKTEETPAE